MNTTANAQALSEQLSEIMARSAMVTPGTPEHAALSQEYQQVYGIGPTRGLVAMRAEESSTRTIGRIYVQLLVP